MKLRNIVSIWMVLTTTFLWTSTMRVLFKPEISSWAVFGIGGKGFEGDFWLLVIAVIMALFGFYIYGRGRCRTLYHVLLVIWNLVITGLVIYGTIQSDSKINFDTWGIEMSFVWLVLPFALFLVLSVFHVIGERKADHLPISSWGEIDWQALIIAVLLIIPALIFFRLGQGFNWQVKIAVASTIIQWIMLVEALRYPFDKKFSQVHQNH